MTFVIGLRINTNNFVLKLFLTLHKVELCFTTSLQICSVHDI